MATGELLVAGEGDGEVAYDAHELRLGLAGVKATGDGESTEVHVPAVRDRLVIWKSDTAMHRQEAWKGSDDMPIASCIELHLIEKA